MTYQGFSAYTANFSGGRNPTSTNQHSNPGHYAYKTLNNVSNDTSLYYHPRGSGDTGHLQILHILVKRMYFMTKTGLDFP